MSSPLYVVVHSAVTPGEGGGVTFRSLQATSTWTAALAAARNTLTPGAGPDDAPWFHCATPARPRSFSVRHPAISQTVNVAVVPRPANLQGGFLFLAGTVTGSALDLTTIQAEASWDDAYAAARRWMVRHAAHPGLAVRPTPGNEFSVQVQFGSTFSALRVCALPALPVASP